MDSGCSKEIEPASAVSAYLAKIKYALEHGATVNFQRSRRGDENRDIRFTNHYTVHELFPDEVPTDALKRELLTLKISDYMGTVKDIRYPKRGAMYEFGKVYRQSDEVYIKVRVKLADLDGGGAHTAFVMSFHFAEKPFSQCYFPYKN